MKVPWYTKALCVVHQNSPYQTRPLNQLPGPEKPTTTTAVLSQEAGHYGCRIRLARAQKDGLPVILDQPDVAGCGRILSKH